MKNNHNGKRKKRGSEFKNTKLGYYMIITDTAETEKNYFEGLRNTLPESIKNNVVIKVEAGIDTNKLIDKAIEFQSMNSQFYDIWIVFDKDDVASFDSIINTAERKGFNVGWSNPCFEIWLSAYFGKMGYYLTSKKCIEDFEKIFINKTKKKYLKNNTNIYSDLIKYGNEEYAIKIATTKLKEANKNNGPLPSSMNPSTTVHLLVEEIKNKTE